MTESKNNSLDIFGIKPVADACNTVTKASVEGASAFLGRICLLAAEEFGLLLRDKVSRWRAANAVAVTNKAQKYVAALSNHQSRHAHPRIVGEVIENASWSDDEQLQSMWAGLLATSCTESGNDQSNLLFINLLSQLTPSETRLIMYGCENSKKIKSPGGWIMIEQELHVTLEKVIEIAGQSDIHRLDLELDHLRGLGLLNPAGGFQINTTNANITPSPLALQLYTRSQGFIGSVLEYFDI